MRSSTRFSEWLTIVAEERRDASRPLGWIAAVFLTLGVLAAMTFVPGLHELFKPRSGTAALCLVPALLAPLLGRLALRNRESLKSRGVLIWIDDALRQFFSASLITLTEFPGSVIMAAVFVLHAGWVGQRRHASWRLPYAAFGTVAAIAPALAWVDSADHWALFGVAGPVALGSSLVLGTAAPLKGDSRQRERELRASIHARDLEESAASTEAIRAKWLHLLELNHDASSVLSALLFQAKLLRDLAVREPDRDSLEELRRAAFALSKGLARIKELLEEGRRVRSGALELTECVALAPELQVAMEVARESSTATFGLVYHGAPQGPLEVLVAGGSLSLQRVLQNVLANAIEGNGRERARRIELHVRTLPAAGLVEIACSDDGPGFSATQLHNGIIAFATTKPLGSGLGLYTSQRLLQASGGRLVRRNRPAGGAEVLLQLPTAKT